MGARGIDRRRRERERERERESERDDMKNFPFCLSGCKVFLLASATANCRHVCLRFVAAQVASCRKSPVRGQSTSRLIRSQTDGMKLLKDLSPMALRMRKSLPNKEKLEVPHLPPLVPLPLPLVPPLSPLPPLPHPHSMIGRQ